MSISNNTPKLQELMDKIQSLPTAENLTPELTEQDALILQIAEALQGKALDNDSEEGGSSSLLLQSKAVVPTTNTQIVTADSGYDGLRQVSIDAMPTATQATPSISVSSSGLITATATQSAGYVEEGIKSATQQLTTKGATTITPTDEEQIAVSAGTYVTGDIKVGANTESRVVSGDVTGTYNGITVNPGFPCRGFFFYNKSNASIYGEFFEGEGKYYGATTRDITKSDTATGSTFTVQGVNFSGGSYRYVAIS